MSMQEIGTVVLDVAGLAAGYGARRVLLDVDLTVQRGEWCTILGSNGVGKSTLLHCVAGRIRPFAGSIQLCGRSLADDLPDALRGLGFACPPEKLPGLLTGRQCLEVHAAAKDLQCIEPATLELADNLKFTPYLDQYVDTYSVGTRQKLSVLLALQGRPPLVVLDEVFNGLDPASSLILKRFLRMRVDAGECSVLLATHALDIALHFSDKAALLLDGRMVRSWDRARLCAMREERADSLEMELASAAAGCQ